MDYDAVKKNKKINMDYDECEIFSKLNYKGKSQIINIWHSIISLG